MTYNPEKHHRRSILLKGYDYSQSGLYFITICVQDRIHLFGKIEQGKMILNDIGKVAQQCWQEIPQHFPNMQLHEFVIMPNHIHGIIEIVVRANNHSPQQPIQTGSPQQSPSKPIGSAIRGFKIGVTKWCRSNTNIYTLWQRNYYEHIIRSDEAYYTIAHYIITNPQRWQEDKLFIP